MNTSFEQVLAELLGAARLQQRPSENKSKKEENWDDVSEADKESMKPNIDKAALELFKDHSEETLRAVQAMKSPLGGIADALGGRRFQYFEDQVYKRAFKFFEVYNEHKGR